METINGEWYMQGCDPDDPKCLHTYEDLIRLIREIGFIPLFSNIIPGFSVEECTPASVWWSEDPGKDPWEWRQVLSRNPDIAYGKFFDKKAGFIAKEWFPVFANYRRNGYDFDALCDDGLVPYRNKKLMDALELDEQLRGLELLSYEIKQKARIDKNFEGVLTELQMQAYLIMSDFRQKKNKKGQEYGWHIAALETPETKWGYDYIASGYKESPEESWKKITGQVKKCFPEAGDKQLRKLLGIRYPGEASKVIKETKPKPEKKRKPHQMPYPDSLFMTLGVEGAYSEDQLEGLTYAMEKLDQRERDVIHARYDDGMTFKEIGSVCLLSLERARTIHNQAIRKIKKDENYYKDGYVRTMLRIQEEKEQYATLLAGISAGADENGTAEMPVSDMGMSERTAKCLVRAGIHTLGDLLVLLAEGPEMLKKIRNLGARSYDEVMKKLDDYGFTLPKC